MSALALVVHERLRIRRNRRRVRTRAETAYHAAAEHLAGLYRDLRTTDDPGDRSVLMRQVAYQLNRQLRVYALAWRQRDTADMMEALGWQIQLAEALADVEAAAAAGMARHRDSAPLLGPVCANILDDMAATWNLANRMLYLDELRDALHDLIGTTAAEMLSTLPYPGKEPAHV